MNEDALIDTLDLIEARRTNLRVDPDRPIPPTLIEQLCRAATHAPNHKLTEPWQFAALTGAARLTLGELAAQELENDGVTDPERLDKTRHKYLRAPVILVVACTPDADPVRHAEDRDAVAAAVQNLLLAATAAGLASYWATGVAARSETVASWCGFEPGSKIVAIVYLGWPVEAAPAKPRSEPNITWLGESPRSG